MYSIQDPVLGNLLGFLHDKTEFVFLDTSRPADENVQSLLFIEPVNRIICRIGDDLERYLDDLQCCLQRGYYLAGWAGYEFGAILEGGIEVKGQVCEGRKGVIADFGIFEKPYGFYHESGKNDLPRSSISASDPGDYVISRLRSNMVKGEYLTALEKVQEYITAGDTYQVNYTLKLLFDFDGNPEKFYRDLRRNQSVAYGAYIRNGEERILSFSPELFFKKTGRRIIVRPMKGTAKRGRNGAEEKMFRKQLQEDSKNRSENVMIVDLLRNDLSRLLHGHGESTVGVDTLFDIESYESLLQMTSTVCAQMPEMEMGNIGLVDIFRALFPCGSITGAPKIRTMQIIDELEKEKRGVYTGAIGYLAPNGDAVFNVPIRTIRLWGGSGEMGVGAGITHDSDPEEEWRESLLKGKFLTHALPYFELFETILWHVESGYWLLDSHLKRLKSSALFFNFFFNIEDIKKLLSSEETKLDNGCKRVRLSLKKDGRVSLTSMSCQPPGVTALPAISHIQKPNNLPLIDFSNKAIDTATSWCFHKTSRREIYDREYNRAKQQGLFELLFCNEAGQVTEGCISNIIIYHQGRFLTPPVSCGLLPGVMREKLFGDRTVDLFEQILTKDMVKSADALFVCNSVRGVVQVRLRR